MQWLQRGICLSYMTFLTLLLVSPDPAHVIGVRGALPWLLQAVLPAAHFLGFLVLAVVALSARWPGPRWGIVAVLAVYAAATEWTQGFVPPRTPEWIDWLQDIGGIAAGAAIYWGATALGRTFGRRWQARNRLPSTSANP
jgi:hypothetical protein